MQCMALLVVSVTARQQDWGASGVGIEAGLYRRCLNNMTVLHRD